MLGVICTARQKRFEQSEIRTHAPEETRFLAHQMSWYSLVWRLGPLGHLSLSPNPNDTIIMIYADFEFGRLFGDVYFRRCGTTYTNNNFLTTGNKKHLNRVRFE